MTATTRKRPEPIPWRRVARLLAPQRRDVIGMVALSTGGVLMGLVPPLALGTLVNALVERGDTAEGALFALVVGVAVVAEAAAYILSDGLYARAAGRLYFDLRRSMLDGARRAVRGGTPVEGVSARFISDAETIERITLSILDSSVMLSVEFVSALVAIAVLEPVSLAATVPWLAATWVTTRRMQAPVAVAGLARQEGLEELTASLDSELQSEAADGNGDHFTSSAARLRDAEVRLGWLRAVNLQGSGGLAKLGPIAVVVVAAFARLHQPGGLVALYLLAQRAFYGFDGMVDMSLDLSGARGAVQRCFALIDTGDAAAVSAAAGRETA